MPGEPYETPAFQNAVTYTVAITYTVAGGVRSATAELHARKIAEQLTIRAARSKRVVEVTAVAGLSSNKDICRPERVRFAAANAGHGSHGEPHKLDRWVDPDRERALHALAEHNAAAETRRDSDWRRRTQIGCANSYPSIFQPFGALCECVYCHPGEHLVAASGDRFHSPRCLCGAAVPEPSQRCLAHGSVELVVLENDPPSLGLLHDQLGSGDHR